MDDIAEVVDLGAVNWLLLREVMRLELNIKRLDLVAVGDHILDEWQILDDNLALEFWVVLAKLDGLVTETGTNVAHHHSALGKILIGQLEVVHWRLTVPDTLLAHALSSHEGLAGFGVDWVVLAPFEDGHIGVHCEVEGGGLRWVGISGLAQVLRNGVVALGHGERVVLDAGSCAGDGKVVCDG